MLWGLSSVSSDPNTSWSCSFTTFFQHCTRASEEDLETAGTSREEEELPFLSTLALVLLLVAVVVVVVLVPEPLASEVMARVVVKELQSTSSRHIQRTCEITTQSSASTWWSYELSQLPLATGMMLLNEGHNRCCKYWPIKSVSCLSPPEMIHLILVSCCCYSYHTIISKCFCQWLDEVLMTSLSQCLFGYGWVQVCVSQLLFICHPIT